MPIEEECKDMRVCQYGRGLTDALANRLVTPEVLEGVARVVLFPFNSRDNLFELELDLMLFAETKQGSACLVDITTLDEPTGRLGTSENRKTADKRNGSLDQSNRLPLPVAQAEVLNSTI